MLDLRCCDYLVYYVKVIRKLRKGELLPSELCKTCQKRISRLRELNAFVTETGKDTTIKAAAESDKRALPGKFQGPLDGIPVAVKDNFSTKNLQTSCASNMLRHYKPPYTSTVVQKLVDDGAILMGKTNLDEFAMGCGSVDGIFGPVRNPWCYDFDLRVETGQVPEDFHIVGGSSGGSAVAVATGMVYAALGSDTGGSVRNPASLTGVVGLKPTYGRLSRHGLISLVNSMDVPGIFARSVDDAAVVLNILSGSDPLDSTSVTRSYQPIDLPQEVSLSGLHIGIPQEYYPSDLATDTVEAWTAVADMLESSGARVSQVSLPHTQYSIVCYHVLCVCEVASNKARYDGVEFGHRATDERFSDALYAATRHEGFNDVVRGRILSGNYFLLRENYQKYFLKAQRVRRLISKDFHKVYQSGVDLLLTPVVLGDAPLFSEFSQKDNRTRTQEQDVFTQPVNMAGLPAVTVPVTLSSRGLPIGLQLIGKSFEEETMLTVAKHIEQWANFPELNLDKYLGDEDDASS